MSKAIEEMPKDFVIKAFLEAHKAEVKGMLLTEYNEAETMELFREDGRAEGLAEGLAKGRIVNLVQNVHALLAETGWSVDKALDVLHVSPEDRSIVVEQL